MYSPVIYDVIVPEGLAAVSGITAYPAETALSVKWAVISSQELFYDAFSVRWAPAGTENWREQTVMDYEFEIQDLQPGTEYNISVAGYNNETLLGDAVFITAFTEIPGKQNLGKFLPLKKFGGSNLIKLFTRAAPSAVEELTVSQVPYSSSIEVTWKDPKYNYGALEYVIVSKCRTEKTG